MFTRKIMRRNPYRLYLSETYFLNMDTMVSYSLWRPFVSPVKSFKVNSAKFSYKYTRKQDYFYDTKLRRKFWREY